MTPNLIHSAAILSIVIIICAAARFVFPAKKHTTIEQENKTEELIAALHPNLLRPLDSHKSSDDEAYLAAFGGAIGVEQRLYNSEILVRICQLEYMAGNITGDELKIPLQYLEELRRLTVFIPIERFIRALYIRHIPHIFTRAIGDMYAEMAATVEALLCENPTALDRLREIS